MSVSAELKPLRADPISHNNTSRVVKGSNSGITNSNISHINSSSNEDENLIRSKREAILTVITPGITPVTGEKLFEESQTRVETPSIRSKVKAFMSSKLVEVFIISLILAYVVLVIAYLVMDDPSYNTPQVHNAMDVLKYVELGILCIFILEILLKVYSFGFKGYYKDCWYMIDTLIVLATFALVIVDIEVDTRKLNGLNKIRGLFRLFRIFLLMRKANEFSRITTNKVKATGFDFKSPAEKILELLTTLKSSTKDKTLKSEIDWAIQMIANNKLYDPIFENTDEKSADKSGANVWLKSYTRNGGPKLTESPLFPKISAKDQRRSVLNPNLNKRNSGIKMGTVSLPRDVNEMLERGVQLLSFDCFAFKKIARDDELFYMTTYLFQINNLFECLSINQIVFYNFIKKVQAGYHPNPYHNALHAADVVQTVHYFLTTGGYMEKADLNNIELAAMYLAAAIHDFDHPGSNNAFQITTNSIYALRYNDKAVLENHHVAASFSLLQEEAYNIFSNFSKADYKVMRERIIAMVLATDMSTHFTDIAKLKGRLAADFNIKDKDKNFTMEMLVHAADISNPSKNWEACHEWTVRITQEFFDQGDQERNKNLPITHLCDKFTVNIGKSQIGFIDFVVAPLLTLLKEILPVLDVSNLETNKGKWKALVEQYDKDLADLNQQKEKDEQIQKIVG